VIVDSETGLRTGFLKIAEELNLPEKDAKDQEVILEAVRRWLRQNAEYLLILDNAEDLKTLKSFLSGGCSGHRLLTARNAATGNVAALPVALLSPGDAALFLLRRSNRNPNRKYETLKDASEDHQEAAKKLAEALGRLPLALDQAGAYIHETPSAGFREYLASYREEKGRILRNRRGDTATGHDSVTVTSAIPGHRISD
jgi:hypothetical protein